MVKISMTEYIEGIVKEFPDNITILEATPALYHIFQVGTETKRTTFVERMTFISQMEILWSKTGYFLLLGNTYILFIILLYPING